MWVLLPSQICYVIVTGGSGLPHPLWLPGSAQKGIGYPKDTNPSGQEFLGQGESRWAIPGK